MRPHFLHSLRIDDGSGLLRNGGMAGGGGGKLVEVRNSPIAPAGGVNLGEPTTTQR